LNEKMLEELSDLKKLDAFVKDSKLKYRDALIAYYKKLGLDAGFTVRENAPVIRNTLNLGRIDLAYLEPNIAFVFEFGNFEEIYRHL